MSSFATDPVDDHGVAYHALCLTRRQAFGDEDAPLDAEPAAVPPRSATDIRRRATITARLAGRTLERQLLRSHGRVGLATAGERLRGVREAIAGEEYKLAWVGRAHRRPCRVRRRMSMDVGNRGNVSGSTCRA